MSAAALPNVPRRCEHCGGSVLAFEREDARLQAGHDLACLACGRAAGFVPRDRGGIELPPRPGTWPCGHPATAANTVTGRDRGVTLRGCRACYQGAAE